MNLIDVFDPGKLDADPSTISGLWPDGRLAFMNQAWFDFAAANGGEPDISTRFGLGVSVLTACPPPLDEYYRVLYRRVIETSQPADHDYECSSPDAYRLYHERIHSIAGGQGLMIIHSLVVERPHDPRERPANVPIDSVYRGSQGLAKQCGHCRRFQRHDYPLQWDWIPDWVRNPPHLVSHGLCEFCLRIYYPA
ncbi:MAG: hypothetical protein M1457_06265 [bacterium]|nr:hypothetical protein [bacterium]